MYYYVTFHINLEYVKFYQIICVYYWLNSKLQENSKKVYSDLEIYSTSISRQENSIKVQSDLEFWPSVKVKTNHLSTDTIAW